MLQKLHKNSRKGFTLVEIMIVVAIIALLAAIALPNLNRARKRSQATRVLEDVRIVETAKQQWALEKVKTGSDTPTWDDLKVYFKPGSALAAANADTLGNAITINNVDTPPQISTTTYTALSEVTDADFWGNYAPSGSGTSTSGT